MPGTREVPALCSVLSLLALKMIGARRVSHVDDVAVDAGLATFAGLESPSGAGPAPTGAAVQLHLQQSVVHQPVVEPGHVGGDIDALGGPVTG